MATKRASKTKKTSNIGRYVTWPSGAKYKIIDENEHLYICEGTQFLKTNPNIAIEDGEEEAVEEKEAE